ncbi:hypothetical protein M0805_001960 [Coniferiporia weirii]|nr:hypothetical protein M0805_001960 [Coniferiporia weirii]
MEKYHPRGMTDVEKCLGLTKHIVNVTEGLSEIFESGERKSPVSVRNYLILHNLPLPPSQAIPEFLEAREKVLSIDYDNMLTAATFFSAVTATTLQLSYAYNSSTRASLGVAVNTLWFVALVFSTASSLNSLVGLMWYQKIRRVQLLSDWAKLWIEYGPTISLAVASAAFSAGLCLFAFSSSQHIITSTLAVAFTTAHAVALFVPLCLYSSNSLSFFLLEAFTTSLILEVFKTPFSYCREVCLKWWYLRSVPRQDRNLVADMMYDEDWSKANVIDAQRKLEDERADERESESETGPNAATSSTGDAGPDSTSSLIGVVERKIKKAWMFARSVVAWPITRRPDWLTLRRRKTHSTEESSNMEQIHGAGTSVTELDELERGNGPQEHAGVPEMQISIATEGQGITLSEEPRTPIRDIIDPNEGAAHTSKVPGEEVGRIPNTRPTPESTKEPTVAISSTADYIPDMSSSSAIRNPENGLENVESQETDALGMPNTSKKEGPGPPFDPSARGY